MESQGLTKYDHSYANLYAERAIKRSYTIAKNLKISEEAKLLDSGLRADYFTFCDIGGNINGTVRGGLGDLIEAGINGSVYYPIDLDINYFLPNRLKNGPNVKFRPTEDIHGIVGNGENLPIKSGSTNIVLISDVLEHVNQPLNALSEARRVLKPDVGHLMVVSPALYKLDAMKPQNVTLQNIDNLIDMNGHVNFFNKENLDHLFRKSGFKSIETKGIGFALSLPFMLWFNEKFIPDNYFNPKLKEMKIYREISDVVNGLPAEVITDIDINLGKQENLKNFYDKLISGDDQTLLNGIYEVLKYSSNFGSNSVIDESYSKLKSLVEGIKINFIGDHIKEKLKQYVNLNGYQFLANSVLIVAN